MWRITKYLQLVILLTFGLLFGFGAYFHPEQYGIVGELLIDGSFISGRFLEALCVVVLILLVFLPYPVMMFNMFRQKRRIEKSRRRNKRAA